MLDLFIAAAKGKDVTKSQCTSHTDIWAAGIFKRVSFNVFHTVPFMLRFVKDIAA